MRWVLKADSMSGYNNIHCFNILAAKRFLRFFAFSSFVLHKISEIETKLAVSWKVGGRGHDGTLGLVMTNKSPRETCCKRWFVHPLNGLQGVRGIVL